jgi:hypothetical protein
MSEISISTPHHPLKGYLAQWKNAQRTPHFGAVTTGPAYPALYTTYIGMRVPDG